VPYTYGLNVDYQRIIRYEVRDLFTVLITNQTGKFTFKNEALGKSFGVWIFFTRKENPDVENWAYATVKPLPGKPVIVTVAWQDTNLEDIGNRKVEYLDDIYLSVQTSNIVPGDKLSAKIYDKETIGADRSVDRILYAEVNQRGIAHFKVSAELLKLFAEKLNAADWINETYHRYYAEIEYYGANMPEENQVVIYQAGNPPPEARLRAHLIEKSETLKIKNAAGQSIPPKNGVKPVVIEEDKAKNKDRKPVKLKLNVFFDGTKNNKTNVSIREKINAMERGEKPEEGEELTREEINAYMMHGGEGQDVSYEQGFSNVAILQMCDASKRKNKELSIYIEGVGTRDLLEDILFPDQAFGRGVSGLKAKVEIAMSRILTDVHRVIGSREYVSEVKVNVFGFSRGAATARHFVSRRSEVAVNTLTSKMNVIFTFVGLFDTVSAYGSNQTDDTEELKLNIGGKALKVLQLRAKDEYRANFKLTDIQSSIMAGTGYELILPGAHSDIGGGYRNNIEESVVSLSGKLVDRLIEEGWYDEKSKEEIPVHYGSVAEGGIPYTPAYSQVSRRISNEYQYIPLNIMANFAIKYGGIRFFDDKLNGYYAKIPGELRNIHAKFVSSANAHDGAHLIAMPIGETDEKKSRKYLHLSAYREGGKTDMMDYFVTRGEYDHGKPKRTILEG
jgi:hypothetical protein